MTGEEIRATIERLRRLEDVTYQSVAGALLGSEPQADELRDALIGILDCDSMDDEELSARGLLRMPMDSDGVPVRIGDRVGTFGDGLEYGEGTVSAIIYGGTPVPSVMCHISALTSEDVVRDPRSLTRREPSSTEATFGRFAADVAKALGVEGFEPEALGQLCREYAERLGKVD